MLLHMIVAMGLLVRLKTDYSNNPNEMNNTVQVIPQAPVATENLDKVTVVPNPYRVSEIWETSIR